MSAEPNIDCVVVKHAMIIERLVENKVVSVSKGTSRRWKELEESIPFHQLQI